MDYDQHHVRSWLLKRPLIKIEALEVQSGCPQGTIRHFLKERRNLPDSHLESITSILIDYGFIAARDE